MTLQDAQQAKDNGTLVVARSNTRSPSIVNMDELIGKPGLIQVVEQFGIMLHGWFWNFEDVEFVPNPALTEALEAISWPVEYNEKNQHIEDSNGAMICDFYLNDHTIKQSHALGHLIAGMLNEVKRK